MYVPAGIMAANRAIQVETMMDTCVLLVYATGRDADNQETTETWTAGTTFVCGFQPAGTREAGTNQVTTEDRLRLPLSAAGVVGSRDRIRRTHAYGVALSPAPEYSVSGDPLVGPTAVTVNLTRVTT